MSILLVAIGIVLLYYGGDFLVRSAGALALRFGVSPMLIGLTVVAFGTSLPELAATLAAAFGGAPELAFGNVVGSNIANVGLILGLTALIYPLATRRGFLRRELPIMLGVVALLFPLLAGGRIGRWEGAVLALGLVGFVVFLFRNDSELLEEGEELGDPNAPLWRWLALIVVGIVLLVLGAQALVTGAVGVARALGVPERVIGLTLVAFGTSLPELASSLVAALKRQTDLILGNIIGSNVFNVLAVLGVTSLVHPISLDMGGVRTDLLVMLAFSAALLPLMWRRARLGRFGGGLLLTGYVLYIGLLFSPG